VDTDGDWVARRATNYGAAFCQILDSSGNFINTFGGSGGTSHADDAAFSIGSASSITPMGALADEASPDSVDEGDAGLVRMTLDRKLLTRVVGATDANRMDVDGAGHAQIDIAADSVGLATAAGQLPDGHNVTVDNAGAGAAVNIQDGGNSITVDGTVTADAGTGPWPVTDNAGSLTVDDGGTALEMQGDAAHDAAVAGNPVLQGLEARTTNPTAVGNGDAVRAMADDVGRQVVIPQAARDLVTENNITLVGTTETTLIAAGGAGVYHDLTFLSASNTSSTGVRLDIRDDTGQTPVLSMYLAPDGGGFVMPFPVPFKAGADNDNWTAQLSAAVTDVRIMAIAVKNV
jgi:hypothetical protein